MTKWAFAILPLLCAAGASAEIIPSWRINPISPSIQSTYGNLNGALSISLMVELTGGSLFNVASLKLSEAMPFVPAFYNQTPFGSDVKPSSALVAIFPDLEFDSYVGTTDGQSPSVPGNAPSIVAVNFAPTGNLFNIRWGATPNSGGAGPREIARITFLPGHGIDPNILVAFPLSAGWVADSLNPSARVPLPPGPFFVVPEPLAGPFAAASLVILRRRRAS